MVHSTDHCRMQYYVTQLFATQIREIGAFAKSQTVACHLYSTILPNSYICLFIKSVPVPIITARCKRHHVEWSKTKTTVVWWLVIVCLFATIARGWLRCWDWRKRYKNGKNRNTKNMLFWRPLTLICGKGKWRIGNQELICVSIQTWMWWVMILYAVVKNENSKIARINVHGAFHFMLDRRHSVYLFGVSYFVIKRICRADFIFLFLSPPFFECWFHQELQDIVRNQINASGNMFLWVQWFASMANLNRFHDLHFCVYLHKFYFCFLILLSLCLSCSLFLPPLIGLFKDNFSMRCPNLCRYFM